MPPIYLGEFEYAVLLAILHLQEDAYAVPVRELIEQRTGRPVARGALYTGLDRLEAKGCLKSRMGDATDERHEALSSMTKGLESLLGRRSTRATEGTES